ncbi:hypothetical protein ABZV24_05680 [Streptomyces sp. NPDC005251]|uniref:hypothetical protein n=1 Tax=Streptomyces sp. NPDC005251 TaxID=3157166 RepID=UPI00339E8EF9
MMKILIVHGIGNYRASIAAEKAAARLKDAWIKDLQIGTSSNTDTFDFSVSVAYYAHLLRKTGAQNAVAHTSLNDDEVQLFLSWADAYGIPLEYAQGVATLPIRQVVSWITDRGSGTTEAVTSLVIRFIREVNEYFTTESKREQARNLVENEIRSKRPDLVIAHSLGSVVAYEALWNSGLPVERLLTVGSPLGLRGGIFDRVIPGPVDGLGGKPNCVHQWQNVADRGDIVAVPRFLSSSYSGITVDQETDIGLFAFHGLSKYLRSTYVGHLIRFGDGATNG